MGTKCIKATGRTVMGISVERIFLTEDSKAAEKAFIETPMEQGGVSSWSVEELEEVPKTHMLACPHCKEEFPNPNTVLEP